jgi:hypothetical protein
MSHYVFFLSRAREAAGLVSKLEERLAQSPGDVSLRLTLSSAVQMAERTERELYEIATAEQVDLCRYRLVRHIGEGFSLQSVSKSLEAFQDAISYVYEAIMGTPRRRAGLTREARRESEMLFGYSYAGSLGVVLLAPSQKGLFTTKFDDVVKTINQVFEIENNDELRHAARAIGPAAINKLYEWAAVNNEAGYDLDLRWTNSNSVESGRYVQVRQFGKLANLISLTSEIEKKAIRTEGVLVGFDSVYKTFHLVEPGGESYKGQLADDFPQHRDWIVNKTYGASISEETTTRFSTGEQSIKHRLSELRLIPDTK